MNWNALGAVGEVVGALAVVLTLGYLAVQIRHSTKSAEDAAFRDVFSAVTVQFSSMLEGPNSDVILKGLVDFNGLTGREKYIFDGLMTSLITLVESSFISNEAQFVSDETMENWSFYLRTRYLSYPGWRDWWQETKQIYIPEAQSWFDRQLQRSDANSDFWGIK